MNLRRPQVRHRKQEPRLGHPLVRHLDLALDPEEIPPPVDQGDLEIETVSRSHRLAKLRIVDPDNENLASGRVGRLKQPDPRGLGQALHQQHSRHDRGAREVALEELLGPRDGLERLEPGQRIEVSDPVDQDERVPGRQPPRETAHFHLG